MGRLRGPAASFTFGYSLKDLGDLRRGRRSSHTQLENATDGIYQRPSGYRTNSFDAKLVTQVSRDRDLIVAYQGSRQSDVPRYDKYEITCSLPRATLQRGWEGSLIPLDLRPTLCLYRGRGLLSRHTWA